MDIDISLTEKLFPNPTTIIVQLIATGILVYFFIKFLWKPLQAYMLKRADYIEGSIREAQEINENAKAYMEKSQQLARDGALEYREVVDRAKEDAQKVKDNMIEEAKKEASVKLAQAQRQIETEKLKAQTKMRQEMVDIALEATKQVLDKELDQDGHKKLVEEFVNEVA